MNEPLTFEGASQNDAKNEIGQLREEITNYKTQIEALTSMLNDETSEKKELVCKKTTFFQKKYFSLYF